MTRVVLAVGLLALSFGAVDRMPLTLNAAPAADRGVLAVVRRDGMMIPFAAYKGSRWTAPWPVSARAREIPVNMEAIPDDWWGGARPDTWRLHLAGGGTRPLTVTTPRIYRAFCDTRIGLVTDYRSAEGMPMPPTDPYPKDGLAISSDIELVPIESVDRESPEIARLVQMILPDFNRAEQQTITEISRREDWTHPEKTDARNARPVTVEAWYRAPMDEPGWIASYVEAVRAYPPGARDDGCGLETVVTGWIHQNTSDPRKTRMQLTARVTFCDRRGIKYMLPFGRIHVGGQLFWVYQFSGFEQEWYEVARMTPLNMSFAVESYGGGRDACGPMRPAL